MRFPSLPIPVNHFADSPLPITPGHAVNNLTPPEAISLLSQIEHEIAGGLSLQIRNLIPKIQG